MFRILQDSLFDPKGLVRQVKRSGWFVFLYLVVMALFMSIGTAIAYLSDDTPLINDETTGCSLVDNSIVCDGENYEVNSLFYVYGIRTYFLNEDMTIDDIPLMEDNCIVIQGDGVEMFLGKSSFGAIPIFASEYGYTSLEAGFGAILTILLVSGLLSNFLMNLGLILAIALISTIMFSRYKKFIKYKKIFKLTVFAVTPVALLITFFNMIEFGMIGFFILSIFAYRTLFILNRHLHMQMTIRRMQQQQEDPNVVDSYNEDDFTDEDQD